MLRYVIRDGEKVLQGYVSWNTITEDGKAMKINGEWQDVPAVTE
jgi:hypothetical protein